ncbi:type II toxin-antitoxin system TacA family antitoxin [Herbaspirillum autotrophicum]|uniref:type II toxin-antitoxin system TacA family antitoxin n=1 Tax=Herbaspirillum autotrophicum TaxID=180195 RepID=UPI00067C1194|nr:DUF1778 domain-containing protein [Herbaspirillum autotrophicum]
MMNATENRDRITARVSQPIATKLQVAADLTGATLNQFLVQAAVEKADKIIDHEQTIRFSRDDAALFMKMLDNPAQSNAALAKAFERRNNKVKNDATNNRTGKNT